MAVRCQLLGRMAILSEACIAIDNMYDIISAYRQRQVCETALSRQKCASLSCALRLRRPLSRQAVGQMEERLELQLQDKKRLLDRLRG
jgi:hypothetical protein